MSTLNIVYGPPCSGKTTYVKNNKSKEDIVVDLDYIKHALTFNEIHSEVDTHTLQLMFKIRETVLKNRIPGKTYWLITTYLEDEYYDFNNVNLIKIQTTQDEVFQMIDNDLTREDKEFWKQLVSSWFNK